MAGNKYDDSSISSLKGAERVRVRPEVMLGTSSIDGTRHTVIEIVGNALDEASSGFGDRVDITYYKDTSISVRDYGRGVPLGWNEKEQRWNWDLIYNELYAGGKYTDYNEQLINYDWSTFNEEKFMAEFSYIFSVGLNGLGGASVQYTSKYFEVISYRDGKSHKMLFENGEPILEELEIEDSDEPNGTFVRWLPDSEVFSYTDVGGDWLYNACLDMLQIAGLDFNFTNESTSYKITVPSGGLLGLFKNKFKDLVKNVDDDGEPVVFQCHDFTHGYSTNKGKSVVYVLKSDIIFSPVTEKANIHCYHNSVPIAGGCQYDAVNMALREFFAEACRGMRLEMSDFDDIMGVVVSTYSNIVSYKGQTKNEISDDFIRTDLYTLLYRRLNMEYSKGNSIIVEAVEKVRSNAETRIAIKEYSKTIKQVNKLAKEKPPEKFVTCTAYNKKQSELAELWITEGDSALGTCKRARKSAFQALFPVRGKVLNVLKASITKILGAGKKEGNDIIKGLFALLETGMDIGEGLFDISKLRFNKIIFATDADVDGYQIRVLLFLVFYKLAPELLRQGHIYIAQTPLFKVRLTNGEDVYAYDDAEMALVREKYGSQIKVISRFKGLGECPADILRETTMNPETRHLIPLVMDSNDKLSMDIIEVLFGKDAGNSRKAVLTEVLGSNVAELIEANELLLSQLDELEIEDGIEYKIV